jgi:hypothetical protein
MKEQDLLVASEMRGPRRQEGSSSTPNLVWGAGQVVEYL